MSQFRYFLALSLLAVPSFADATRDLLLAARSGDLGEVRRLVASGLSVNASDEWGTTPLALAARLSQAEVARYLLDQEADPSARETFFGMSALDFALWTGEPDFQIAKICSREAPGFFDLRATCTGQDC